MENDEICVSAGVPTDESADSHHSRRRVFTTIGGTIVAMLSGCLNGNNKETPIEPEIASPQNATNEDVSPTPTTSPREAVAMLESARTDFAHAFDEIQSIDLVAYPERVWTPKYRKLGDMDCEQVNTRVQSARSTLGEIKQRIEPDTRLTATVELLFEIATVAELGAEFYDTFALTFEKIYQYEYLTEDNIDYSRGVEKIGRAREQLANWQPVVTDLSDAVETVADIQQPNDNFETDISSFDREKWRYIVSTAGELAHRFEPQLTGFESYAEALSTDQGGLEQLRNDNYQAALEQFDTARSKIFQAAKKFDEADERGPSFFEPRATAYRDRVPDIYKGITLHVRATNELMNGNPEQGGDLRFKGTTKIRSTIDRNPVKDDSEETA